MAFRDSFDKCPRCATSLEDARSARGCRTCGGLFVEATVLAEMLLEMLPVPRPIRLRIDPTSRATPALACPTCGDPMTPFVMHQVELDHCPKHGVWFDRSELSRVLRASAAP